METTEISLPARVRKVRVDGREVYLIGTAHLSKESVEDVRTTVEVLQPDTVCVELCEARYKAIIQRDAWKQMNIFKVIREKKALFLLTQLILSSFYRRLGEQLGVQPGAEMIEGIRQAEAHGAELVLADRDIQMTLKRVWGYLGLWNKLKMMVHLVGSLFTTEDVDAEMIEEMKKGDQLESVLKEFAEAFPEVKKRLLDERDIYLAQKIRRAPGEKIVAVIGAAHVPGIEEHIHRDEPLEPLMETPPKSVVPTLLKWGIPLLIIFLLVFGFFKGGATHSMESVYIWFLVNGVLSALGAAAAFAHPLTIASAFFGAPITSLNPMIAAGWVAGLVQAWVKKPTVKDLEDLPDAITTVRGFWTNPVSRILLVVVLANLGSAIGTFIAGGWIAARTF
ncbi:MAG: TraB/GumN family protein [Deltaproteobacteria bacterium]|nr:TraB/GumN family protein [Deltaproteobacteria bacterium]